MSRNKTVRAAKRKAARKGPHQPHDTRYKQLFSNTARFLDFLRDFVKEPWVDEIDESNLTKVSNSFIAPDLSRKEADIIYEAKVNGATIIFYVLLEIQSTVDHMMPYRLLLYMIEVLRAYYNNARKLNRLGKDFKFPVVFPIVFYNGKQNWTVPLNLRDMFADAEKFGSHALNFEYLLVNVKGYDKESLGALTSKLLRIIMELEISRNDVEFLSVLRDNIDTIGGLTADEKEILGRFMELLDKTYGYDKGKAIASLLKEDIREAEQMLCGMVESAEVEKEQLLAKGRMEGHLEGLEQVAKELLMEKMPVDFIVRTTKLPKEKVKSLELSMAQA